VIDSTVICSYSEPLNRIFALKIGLGILEEEDEALLGADVLNDYASLTQFAPHLQLEHHSLPSGASHWRKSWVTCSRNHTFAKRNC